MKKLTRRIVTYFLRKPFISNLAKELNKEDTKEYVKELEDCPLVRRVERGNRVSVRLNGSEGTFELMESQDIDYAFWVLKNQIIGNLQFTLEQWEEYKKHIPIILKEKS